MYTPLPEGKLVIVKPPDIWVQWGIVDKDTYWTLEKAVYGLRESPALWSAERDNKLGKVSYLLKVDILALLNLCLRRSSPHRNSSLRPHN